MIEEIRPIAPVKTINPTKILKKNEILILERSRKRETPYLSLSSPFCFLSQEDSRKEKLNLREMERIDSHCSGEGVYIKGGFYNKAPVLSITSKRPLYFTFL